MAALHKTSSDHHHHFDLRSCVLGMRLRGCLSRNRLAGSGSVPDLPLTPTGLEDRDFAAITRSSHCWILFDKFKPNGGQYIVILFIVCDQCPKIFGHRSFGIIIVMLFAWRASFILTFVIIICYFAPFSDSSSPPCIDPSGVSL